MENNNQKFDTLNNVNYRGVEYITFESTPGLKYTRFDGKSFKGLEEGLFVSIKDQAYKIISTLEEFKGIKPQKDETTQCDYIMSYIFLCEIELSHNKKINAIDKCIFLENFYYSNIAKDKEPASLFPLSSIRFLTVEFEKDCIITNNNYNQIPNIEFVRCHFGKKLKIRNEEETNLININLETEYKKAQRQ